MRRPRQRKAGAPRDTNGASSLACVFAKKAMSRAHAIQVILLRWAMMARRGTLMVPSLLPLNRRQRRPSLCCSGGGASWTGSALTFRNLHLEGRTRLFPRQRRQDGMIGYRRGEATCSDFLAAARADTAPRSFVEEIRIKRQQRNPAQV